MKKEASEIHQPFQQAEIMIKTDYLGCWQTFVKINITYAYLDGYSLGRRKFFHDKLFRRSSRIGERTSRQRTFSSEKFLPRMGYFLTGDEREDKNVIREHECFERFCPVNFYTYEIKKRGEVGRNEKKWRDTTSLCITKTTRLSSLWKLEKDSSKRILAF